MFLFESKKIFNIFILLIFKIIIQRLSYGKPKTKKNNKKINKQYLNCELKFIIASFNTKSENKTRNI